MIVNRDGLIKTGDEQFLMLDSSPKFLMFDSSPTTPLVFYVVGMIVLVTQASLVILHIFSFHSASLDGCYCSLFSLVYF